MSNPSMVGKSKIHCLAPCNLLSMEKFKAHCMGGKQDSLTWNRECVLIRRTEHMYDECVGELLSFHEVLYQKSGVEGQGLFLSIYV